MSALDFSISLQRMAFEVLTALKKLMVVSWVMMPMNL
jgi:hypothetical protein